LQEIRRELASSDQVDILVVSVSPRHLDCRGSF